MFFIQKKDAVLYVSQLHNLLAAKDATMVLGNPFTRAVLIALAKDLAAMINGPSGEELRAMLATLRIPLEGGGELYVTDPIPPKRTEAEAEDCK